jgi:hypothetical protein
MLFRNATHSFTLLVIMNNVRTSFHLELIEHINDSGVVILKCPGRQKTAHSGQCTG